MLAEHDQKRAGEGLHLIQFLEQRIGRRATGATLRREQLENHRLARGVRRNGGCERGRGRNQSEAGEQSE
jgi:hypothetical protein